MTAFLRSRPAGLPASHPNASSKVVESAINALEVHSLDKCRDHGITGFKRYVELAVVTRKIHRIGDIVWKREQQREKQRRALKIARRPRATPRSPRPALHAQTD